MNRSKSCPRPIVQRFPPRSRKSTIAFLPGVFAFTASTLPFVILACFPSEVSSQIVPFRSSAALAIRKRDGQCGSGYVTNRPLRKQWIPAGSDPPKTTLPFPKKRPVGDPQVLRGNVEESSGSLLPLHDGVARQDPQVAGVIAGNSSNMVVGKSVQGCVHGEASMAIARYAAVLGAEPQLAI